MSKLHEIDPVAYVRFASVYRDFRDINDLKSEVDKLFTHPTVKNP
jgi:transcriptional repressor NrdR